MIETVIARRRKRGDASDVTMPVIGTSPGFRSMICFITAILQGVSDWRCGGPVLARRLWKLAQESIQSVLEVIPGKLQEGTPVPTFHNRCKNHRTQSFFSRSHLANRTGFVQPTLFSRILRKMQVDSKIKSLSTGFKMRDDVKFPIGKAQSLEALLREISKALECENALERLVSLGISKQVNDHANALDDALLKAGS